jgi:phage replication O-like protein O
MAAQRANTTVTEKIQYSFVPNHRETMQALARAKFNNQEFRVVIALLNQTNGYLRQEDELSSAFWQALTFMSRQHVHTTLNKLVSLGVIAKNEHRYKVNHPNAWSPEVFKPQRLARRSISIARSLLSKERQRHDYRWLDTILLKASSTRDDLKLPKSSPELKASLTRDDSINKTKVSPTRDDLTKTVPNQGRSASPTRDDLKLPKESLKRKHTKESPVAPSRSREGMPTKEIKPFQKEAGAFLDWVSSQERIKFANRAKLMGLIRGTLIATEASLGDLQEWYHWVKENDSYWGAREPPVIISKAQEKFPTWLRDRKEGRLHEQKRGLREPGRRPRIDGSRPASDFTGDW